MSQQKPRPLDADTQEIPKSPSIPRDAQEDDYSEGVPAEDYPMNPDPPSDEPAEEEARRLEREEREKREGGKAPEADDDDKK